MTTTLGPLMPHSKLAAKYSVKPRTLDDWVKRGALPEPIRICGRKYWPVDTVPKQESAARVPASGGAREKRKRVRR